MDNYQHYIYKSKYSRWVENEGRREYWCETVHRYITFIRGVGEAHGFRDDDIYNSLSEAIYNMHVMPSMRLLWSAGEAAEKENASAYNCAYLRINEPSSFAELLYLSMCGCGVGYSVERQVVKMLPEVPAYFTSTEQTIEVEDTRRGWASALLDLVNYLYKGVIPCWNLSKLRPAGSKLRTSGGTASGPGPLNQLFRTVVNIFENSRGEKLSSLDCHSLCCAIGRAVVAGGVRRTAFLSLSNPSDLRMRNAKWGDWHNINPHFSYANNSAAWTESPPMSTFFDEWYALYISKSGERGIFNRSSVEGMARSLNRDLGFEPGCNPCGEITLRDREFCNLTEVVVRPDDSWDTIEYKVKQATILGTLQSLLDQYSDILPSTWNRNVCSERLLGVSLTGIMDNHLTSNPTIASLNHLRTIVRLTNEDMARRLGINASASYTCIKPSGTVSQLVGCSPGIHPCYAPYYIRNIRSNIVDPITGFLITQGVPHEPDDTDPSARVVFSFPIANSEYSIFRKNISAKSQLDLWLLYSTYWATHNVSCTVQVREHEWLDVGSWVFNNFNSIRGLSFLPYSESTYTQLPYQDCTRREYWQLVERMPKLIDWNNLSKWETQDETTPPLACEGSVCNVE